MESRFLLKCPIETLNGGASRLVFYLKRTWNAIGVIFWQPVVDVGHELWCNDLRVLLDLNLEQSRRGHISCPLPRRQLTDCQELSDSIKEFLVTRMLGPMGAMALVWSFFSLFATNYNCIVPVGIVFFQNREATETALDIDQLDFYVLSDINRVASPFTYVT